MCGIAAWFESKKRAGRIDLDAVAHRGPDAAGEWQSADSKVWFGHRRLSILELSEAGAQPMQDPITGNVVIFNGEIYNHLEVRKDLAAHWRGSSDTETILIGYREWGAKVIDRLEGMFSLIIFDATKKELFVARDRLGIKPLYFRRSESGVVFCSEVRPLLQFAPGVVNKVAVADYLRHGCCRDEMVLWSGVHTVPAGHRLYVSPDAEITSDRYWVLPQSKDVAEGDPVLKVREKMETAVRQHLLSDVPVAVFLSGGIDSSIITGIAARQHNGPLATFSVGFREQGFDESAVAVEVARKWNTRHRRIELSEKETLALVCDAVESLDLPSQDAINTYIVSRKVAEAGYKVALSGLGADELFGGYPSFNDVPRLVWLSRLPRWSRALFACLGRSGARLAELPGPDVATLAVWRRVMWTDAMLKRAGLDVAPLSSTANAELGDDFAQISWAELSGYMRNMLLRDSDQMSMAVSLELRVPFLDRSLVEYVLTIPEKNKRAYGSTKGLLVAAFRDILPGSVYNRPKMGFGLPMDSWLRGPLEHYVTEGVRKLRERNIVSDAAIDATVLEFRARNLHWTRLWSLVVLGHYLSRNSTLGGCSS